ncbi:MAG: class IV adenylate cyclase [Bacteroidales bacterium]|nr:class IV adenylate cyclase [Bacteroidales bacterium]
MKHINIEIKARAESNDKIRSILKSKNADFKGIDHQVDTYFNIPSGRLKLRQGNIENSLIFYRRENTAEPKESDVSLYRAKETGDLKQVLQSALGKLVTVDKQREIYFINNVKFHLDSVKGLGEFVEIEAIGKQENERETLLKQCNYYLQLFDIEDKNLISVSYSDMLLNKKRDCL